MRSRVLNVLGILLLCAAGFGVLLCPMGSESLVVGGMPAKVKWLGFAAMVVDAPLAALLWLGAITKGK